MPETSDGTPVQFPPDHTMPFDHRWGISPACFWGDHDIEAIEDECSGTWHTDWFQGDDFVPRENGWEFCRCACHEYVTDNMWNNIHSGLREILNRLDSDETNS